MHARLYCEDEVMAYNICEEIKDKLCNGDIALKSYTRGETQNPHFRSFNSTNILLFTFNLCFVLQLHSNI